MQTCELTDVTWLGNAGASLDYSAWMVGQYLHIFNDSHLISYIDSLPISVHGKRDFR